MVMIGLCFMAGAIRFLSYIFHSILMATGKTRINLAFSERTQRSRTDIFSNTSPSSLYFEDEAEKNYYYLNYLVTHRLAHQLGAEMLKKIERNSFRIETKDKKKPQKIIFLPGNISFSWKRRRRRCIIYVAVMAASMRDQKRTKEATKYSEHPRTGHITGIVNYAN